MIQRLTKNYRKSANSCNYNYLKLQTIKTFSTIVNAHPQILNFISILIHIISSLKTKFKIFQIHKKLI